MIRYTFPMGEETAVLVLPRDLTKGEVERLTAFIYALVPPCEHGVMADGYCRACEDD